jgi:hypothetical protein
VILPLVFALLWLLYVTTVALCPVKLGSSLREANRAAGTR